MREGKELILATKDFAVENRLKSWFSLISTLVLFVVSLLGTYQPESLLIRIFFSLLTSLLIVRLFVIYHDNQHGAILTNDFFADIIFTLFGLYILAPTGIWKRSHDHHHKHNSKLINSTIGAYPTLSKAQYLKCSRSEQQKYLMARHPLTVFMGYLTVFMLGLNLNSFLNSPKKHIDSIVSIILHFVFTYLIIHFLGWSAYFLSWLIPFVVACGLGSYMFYCQHNFPGAKFNEGLSWTYHGAALESTSFMKMGKLMNWFTGNIGYHHIHHVNVRIPFYRLPEVYAAFPEFQHAISTTWSITDIIACFRLKLWDPEKQRMISLKEL